MAPPRKSRSVNKRFSYDTEISPTKDGDNINKKSQRKKKLSDMLGPHWSKEELKHFYEAYRKHGIDWRKVAAVLRNRSMEMVEAVYSLNKAYLSLPEGTASVAGFIAMMTDYYSNMEDRDSEQERNDGGGTSRKPQKRTPRKVNETTSKGTVDRFSFRQDAVSSDYGCLSLLKKKRSGGSRPRAVGKRTPRFPVSHSFENVKGEKYLFPQRKGQKPRADNDEDVHSIAMALAEASKRGGSRSPQVSHSRVIRSDSMMSSPSHSADRMNEESDVASGWFVDNEMYDDDKEGSMEADNTDFSRDNKNKEKVNYTLHDRKVSQGKKVRIDKKSYIREACSGTEGQNLDTLRRNFDVEVADTKPSRPLSQGSKKRSKETSTMKDESSAFDALETLANLSLMILPETNENDSIMQAKEGKNERVDDSRLLLGTPSSRHKEKRKSSGVTVKGNSSISRLEAADDKAQTSTKDIVASEAKDLITKVSRKRQKIVAPKISKAETSIDATAKESLEAEATDASQSKHISQSSAPHLVNNGKHISSSIYSRKEGRNSSQSDVQMNTSIHSKVRNKRKMYKPHSLEVAKHSNVVGTEKSTVHFKNCLSNPHMRRWCAFEWFYSAIDDPWFSKREFVEYLYHVGLGHVPRLTRVEWGVIRSSLGKPRRFSAEFLKEEKEKLNQYRDSVRTHYTELRSGSRDGLPTDLARPLSVGQRVIAIYPKTREVHDGTVLTVDHNMCRVQFDRPELGVEKIMDTDCMPLNPFENMPASLIRQTSAGIFFESLIEGKMNGKAVKDQRSSSEKLENMDEVASQPRNGAREISSNSMPYTVAQLQAKEADVEAIAELTRALDKKEAVVFELRRMNDDVLENQTDGDSCLKDSEAFKKQYAAVLVQLNEANSQVSSALHRLRQRNTYQRNFNPKTLGDLHDHGVISQTQESEFQVNEIVEVSRIKARTMVDIAIQAMSSMKLSPTVDLDMAVDYVIDRLPSHEQLASSVKPPMNGTSSDLNKIPYPSELITRCVTALFVIQKCTEREFPPAEVASILDSAVTSLQPCSPQNVQIYGEIQKYMGILKNKILALVPT